MGLAAAFHDPQLPDRQRRCHNPSPAPAMGRKCCSQVWAASVLSATGMLLRMGKARSPLQIPAPEGWEDALPAMEQH